jgi:hypothetical protein
MRRALNQSGERTLVAALIPPGPGHIDGCFSLAFASKRNLLSLLASSLSLASDFLIKTTGKGDIRIGLAMLLPLLPESPGLFVRALLLNCINSYYRSLWNECFDETFTKSRWSKQDIRLDNARFSALTPQWSWNVPMRTDYERRQALAEIDVLAARALKLSLQELIAIYRLQFAVLYQNEKDTWYDNRGRIVFTCSKAVPGVGFSRTEWERVRNITSGVVTRTVQDETQPGARVNGPLSTLRLSTAATVRLTILRPGSSSRKMESDSFGHNPADRARSEGVPPHNFPDHQSVLCRHPGEAPRHAGDVVPRPVPFRQATICPSRGWPPPFPEVLPADFAPYRHQQQAWDRLDTRVGRSTIVATGTGSGKTECFLYPILDHCFKQRGRRGIKAILIYPMNALATDQAQRLAKMIWQNPELNGFVTAACGLAGRKISPHR